jgi:hypothetical protein
MIAGSQKPRIEHWFVDVDGRRLGPFTLDQLQAELNAGRIRAEHSAISTSPTGGPGHAGETTTVRQVLDAYLDPAVTLFETLRAAKEKRAASRQRDFYDSSLSKDGDAFFDRFKKLPDHLWMALALVGVATALLMGAVHFMKESGKMLSTDSTPRAAPPHVETHAPAPAPAHPVVAAPLIPQTKTVPPATFPVIRRPAVPAPRVTVTPARRDDDDRRDDRRDERDDRRDDRDNRDDRRERDLRDDQPVDRDPMDRAQPTERLAPGDTLRNPNAVEPDRNNAPQRYEPP